MTSLDATSHARADADSASTPRRASGRRRSLSELGTGAGSADRKLQPHRPEARRLSGSNTSDSSDDDHSPSDDMHDTSDSDDNGESALNRLLRKGDRARRRTVRAVLRSLLLGVLAVAAVRMVCTSAVMSSTGTGTSKTISQRFVRTGAGFNAVPAVAAAAAPMTPPRLTSSSTDPEAAASPSTLRNHTPAFDASVARDRGIVLCLHDGIVAMGVSLIKELRCLGNTELVQVFHCLPDELSEASRALLLRADDRVEIIDVCSALLARNDITRELATQFRNWWIKPLAMHYTTLREPILLDADAVLLHDPAALRRTDGYKRTGTTFFYDRVMGCDLYFNRKVGNGEQYLKALVRSFDYTSFGLVGPAPSAHLRASFAYSETSCHEQDSSMVLLNKDRMRRGKALDVLWWLVTRERVQHEFSWGDKESFWLAFELAHMDYFFSPWGAAVVSSTPNRDMERHNDTLCGSLAQYVPVDDDAPPTLLYVNGKALLDAFPDGVRGVKTVGDNNLYNTNPTHVVPRQVRTAIKPTRESFYSECMVGLGATPLPPTFAEHLLRRRMFFLAATTGVERALQQCHPFGA